MITLYVFVIKSLSVSKVHRLRISKQYVQKVVCQYLLFHEISFPDYQWWVSQPFPFKWQVENRPNNQNSHILQTNDCYYRLWFLAQLSWMDRLGMHTCISRWQLKFNLMIFKCHWLSHSWYWHLFNTAFPCGHWNEIKDYGSDLLASQWKGSWTDVSYTCHIYWILVCFQLWHVFLNIFVFKWIITVNTTILCVDIKRKRMREGE